jgi:opacity protein-like surface antigen
MSKNYSRSLLVLLACTLCNSSFAKMIVSLNASADLQRDRHSRTIDLTDSVTKSYRTDSNSFYAAGEAFIGVESRLTENLNNQFGVAFQTTTDTEVRGRIWDDANIEFENHKFKYKVNHQHIAAKTKFLIQSSKTWKSWISLSAGIGRNRAHGFSNKPLIEEATVNPNFGDNTTTNAFTYRVGFGFEQVLSKNMSYSVGYEFADWGRFKLGKNSYQNTDKTIAQNNLYSHGLAVGLNFSL